MSDFMTDDWKSLINETTDEIKSLTAEKAVKENKFEENSAQAKTIRDTIIIPALNELKVELDKHHTPANVSTSGNTVSGETPPSGETCYSGSITVSLSGLLLDANKNIERSGSYPEFFYEICLLASRYKLSYNNTCRVADARGSRELGGTHRLPTTFDLTESSISELTGENIKQDFALRYKQSADVLRTRKSIMEM